MSKRTQKESGEERVTARSRPMMNLIARSSERALVVLSSTASESPGKTKHESQSPLSTPAEKYDRTGRPVVRPQGGGHASQTRFSREYKNVILEEEENHDRTERPVVCPQGEAHQFATEDDETQSELSLGSRSILHRVNDQVRKRQKQSSINATEDSEEHYVIWGQHCKHLYSWGRITQTIGIFIKNTKDLTMKQMFDISEKLVSEQSDEIFWVNTMNWEDSSWTHLSLVGDEEVISLSNTKIHVFSDSVLSFGRMNENPRSNIAWEDRLMWFKSSPEYRALDRIDGEPMEFEWNIFPGFTTLQLSHKVQELLLRLGETPENFCTGRIIFMSMFNDISWRSKDNKKECESNAQLVSLLAKRFGAGQWSFLGPGSEKKWYSISEDRPQGEWDKMAEKMMVTLAESGHPVFRATSSLSRGVLKSKGGGKLSIHYCADQESTKIFCCSNMWNELKSCHNKDQLSKFCMDAGFLNVVEIGQYFMTKDTAEFSQVRAVACREYTLPRREEASQPKGLIQGNTKRWPVLEVTTSFLHGKYGVEIRIWSLNRDNTHSWVRIFRGSNRFVMHVNNNETACRSKAKAKLQKKRTCRLLPKNSSHWEKNLDWCWTRENSFSDYEVSKKLMYLLRPCKTCASRRRWSNSILEN